MSISMAAEKKTPTEVRMRAAMSARLQLMLKRHPQITTYYKLEAAAKVSSRGSAGNHEKFPENRLLF